MRECPSSARVRDRQDPACARGRPAPRLRTSPRTSAGSVRARTPGLCLHVRLITAHISAQLVPARAPRCFTRECPVILRTNARLARARALSYFMHEHQALCGWFPSWFPAAPSVFPERGLPGGCSPQRGRKERGRAGVTQRCGCCGCAATVREESPTPQPAQSSLACLGTPELVREQGCALLDRKKPTLVSAMA